jgi:hypothetical protein
MWIFLLAGGFILLAGLALALGSFWSIGHFLGTVCKGKGDD